MCNDKPNTLDGLEFLDLELEKFDFELPTVDSNIHELDSGLNLAPKERGELELKELESIKVNKEDGVITVNFKHLESFEDAFGSINENLLKRSIRDVLQFYSHLTQDQTTIEEKTNFDMSVLDDLKPSDPLEGIMLKQILMTHAAINKYYVDSVYHNQTVEGKDMNISRVTKLIRAFNTQVQTYIKYTKGGHQKVTVQHVNVSDGSQAIIGNITPNTQKKRGGHKKKT